MQVPPHPLSLASLTVSPPTVSAQRLVVVARLSWLADGRRSRLASQAPLQFPAHKFTRKAASAAPLFVQLFDADRRRNVSRRSVTRFARSRARRRRRRPNATHPEVLSIPDGPIPPLTTRAEKSFSNAKSVGFDRKDSNTDDNRASVPTRAVLCKSMTSSTKPEVRDVSLRRRRRYRATAAGNTRRELGEDWTCSSRNVRSYMHTYIDTHIQTISSPYAAPYRAGVKQETQTRQTRRWRGTLCADKPKFHGSSFLVASSQHVRHAQFPRNVSATSW